MINVSIAIVGEWNRKWQTKIKREVFPFHWILERMKDKFFISGEDGGKDNVSKKRWRKG